MPRQWDDYFWPGTTVLSNIPGITDQDQLDHYEYFRTAVREQEIHAGAVHIDRTFDAAHLTAVHQHLFQDVYEWAGDQELLQQMHHSSFPQAERGMSRCVNEAV